VNVASGSHRRAQIHFDDLQMARRYNPFEAYGQSKLANVLFTYELARRIEGTGVTANAVHPGFVATEIGKDNGLLARVVLWFLHLRARSPEQGAETPIYLAASPEVAGVTGEYFVDKRPVRSSPVSYDRDVARRLWERSERLVGISEGQ
jgi:NAD(P)-dependent dehydrogenase (short-subunit alcohol dehydrogenase family)